MNYEFHYNQLISTRKNRVLDECEVYERHHILPKKLGGTDDESNLIHLTIREHFIAHWLLWRIYRNRETAFSFYIMSNRYKNRSSRAFSEAKIARRQIGFSMETREKMSKRKKEYYSSNEHYKTIGSRNGIVYRSLTQSKSLSSTHKRKAADFDKLHNYEIFQYNLEGKLEKVWKGLGELRAVFGDKALHILRVIERAKTSKSQGYKWTKQEV